MKRKVNHRAFKDLKLTLADVCWQTQAARALRDTPQSAVDDNSHILRNNEWRSQPYRGHDGGMSIIKLLSSVTDPNPIPSIVVMPKLTEPSHTAY